MGGHIQESVLVSTLKRRLHSSHFENVKGLIVVSPPNRSALLTGTGYQQG